MKPHYFHVPEVDADDTPLRQAIREGKVPSGCRLGGLLVQGRLGRNEDPCSTCDGDRERCGGRRATDPEVVQRLASTGGERGTVAGDSAQARKLFRQFQGEAILAACKVPGGEER